jgi:tetratricopeptide (TPR) repeat protein
VRPLYSTVVLLALVSLAAIVVIAADDDGGSDFDAQVRKAAGAIEPALRASEKKMTVGDFDGANASLLAAFPEEGRTAAQAFLLGNALFETDRKLSYGLHKFAAGAAPGNPNVIWEWAIEQHRTGEYAAALESYKAFSKTRPRSASPYALEADCLLRLNRIDEAVQAWRESEAAANGSIEQMENLVCAVHREPAPFARRAELLSKATSKRDAHAAAELIALDCDFPRDWWNAGPHKAFLDRDLKAVNDVLRLPVDDVRARAIACAADCALVDHTDAAAVRAILSKHRLLSDADHTIPNHGGLMGVIAIAVIQSKAIDEGTLRNEIGPKVLEIARRTKDGRLWNVAAYLAPLNDQPLEREGWKVTGDPRFAAGLLYLKARAGELKSDDAELAAALKQFPEDGRIQRIAFETAKAENKLTRDRLVAAAEAEFHHFSSFVAPATVVNRPRSDYLRQYFALLLRMEGAATTQPVEKRRS